MCSSNEDCDLSYCFQNLQCSNKKFEKICRKCASNNPQVMLRGKDIYCRSCFENATIHKFRAAIGKTRLIKYDENVLVEYTGNVTSVVLSHLVQTAVNDTSHKQLRIKPSYLYIDERSLYDNIEEHETRLIQIKHRMDKHNLNCYYIPIDDVFVDSEKTAIKNMFRSITSTSKIDLLRSLRKKLMLKFASSIGCSKIFTTEVGSELAVKLLSHVALGRGSQLAEEVGICDRSAETIIMRPLMELTSKEIVFFALFNDLHYFTKLSFEYDETGQSIQNLIETFVNDLQVNFPSTTSTISKTGGKLKINVENSESRPLCPLCCAPRRVENMLYSAIDDLHFSKLNDKKKSDENDKQNDLNLFCYACQHVLREMKSLDCPPGEIFHSNDN